MIGIVLASDKMELVFQHCLTAWTLFQSIITYESSSHCDLPFAKGLQIMHEFKPLTTGCICLVVAESFDRGEIDCLPY
jgi:hypothetical protein